MVKKIFDILPPDKIEEIEVLEEEDSEKKEPLKAKPMVLSFILILIGTFCYFYFPKATIVIFPESEILSFETDLIVDKNLNNIDYSSLAIPGEFYTAEKIIFEEFQATDTAFKESQALGVIRVYNTYSTSSQTLVVNTRFMSTEGKLFRTTKRITVPGGHYEGGELVPGFLDVQVKADQPGEDFNIGPSTFSIPGFAGTARYTFFYGKSFQSMSGGFKREVSQVSQKDLDEAEKSLEEKVIDECLTELNEKISSEYVLLEQAIETKTPVIFSSIAVEEEADKFIFRMKTECSVLVFKDEDVKDFIIDFISSQILTDKKIYLESLDLNYDLIDIDFDLGKIRFDLKARAKIYSDINEINLKQDLKGKSLDETEFYLKNYPQIETSSVQFWPFWVKNVPQNDEKIKLELNLD
jgi:hypothetical protein